MSAEAEQSTDHGHGLPPASSVKRWLVTTNHKDVGILYTVTALFFLVFGGVLALLMRIQLWTPGEGFLAAVSYNQAVSAHGLIMIFWFLSPFAFGFANYVVPLQIGARDLAFPRLNALSYWLYLFSGILFGVSFFQGGTFAGGWTMYAPLNIPVYTPNIGASTAVLALVLFVASVTVSSVNFLTSMHRMRAEGMTLRRMPLFSWTILLTVWMMLFAFAALLAALLILSSDRLLGTQYFAATDAGGSLLWAHLFWFFGHPEVYIVFFPALGVMAETFQTFTGRRIVGRKWFIAAMVLVALQSFVVWMHHMFLTSINLQIKTLFMATTIGISLPFDLMVFALIYTLIKGRVRFTTPFLFSFGALVLFIIGGITGVFLGAVVLDYEFRGTYWVVAHFHYVMVGGVTALFGGLYYWFPKMTGKMYDEFLGKVHFALYFVGFNLLYFPMFLAWETPRRDFVYPEAFVSLHQLSTVGGFILGASFLVMFYNLSKSLLVGEEAGDNPWAYSVTTEWALPSPPPLENFPGRPTFETGMLEFRRGPGGTERSGVEAADGGEPTADGGEPSTDGGAAYVAEIEAESGHDEDHASPWPFAIGLASFVALLGFSGLQQGGFPTGLSGGFYAGLTGGGLVLLGWTLVRLARERFNGPVGPFGESWPFENVENTKLGVWLFLASDVVLFGAFIGSYVFIRVAHGWTDWHDLIPEAHVVLPGLINTYLLLTSSFAVVLALVAAERESRWGLVASLGLTFALGVAFLVNKALEWLHLFDLHGGAFAGGWLPSTNVASSTFYLTTGLHGLHVIAGLFISLYLIARAWGGAYLDDERPVEYFGLYWHFVDIVWLFLFPLFYIL
ncbi:cbb3-type cytochrome c oxidase subunit I [Halorussus amylolyticus]|uniref:cbb3-type cytochrome c oxidase subunit I n=1 Tax=Halorussus amylolyticus TaxID=1126242 RepID=UPI00104B9D0F|nr:cbb3-type cytochrome c oxidase subunit I [Halorussus amylolyticus]